MPVVPAGGAGTRLWPLSRRDRPKFLLDLTGGGRSLLQETLARVAPLADRMPIVVTGAAHEADVAHQVGDGARVLAEPSPRGSMPAIALAAAIALGEDEDAVIGSFAADHLVGDEEAFVRAVDAARRAAALGLLVTIGIEPDRPATGFGYIQEQRTGPEEDAGRGAGHGVDDAPTRAADEPLAATGAVPVARFVEKPSREVAEQFLADGDFRWNAGMFVVGARVLLDALARQIPSLAEGVLRIAGAHGTPEGPRVLAELWPTLTNIAIDHALAEPLAARGEVAMVPAAFGWDDVGDFGALARQLRAPGAGGAAVRSVADGDVLVLGDVETVGLDARATVYGSSDRLVALVGVSGVSVVAAEDALLVVADDSAQEVGALGTLLDELGRGDLR